MKKFGIATLSVLTLMLGFVLVGCSFKDPKVSFSQSEVLISVEESLDLEEYISLEGVSIDEISFHASNSLIEIDDKTVVGVSYGKSYVYAMYDNSCLATLQVVVKKPFDSPELSIDENYLLSWNVVSGIFDGEVTVATQYLIEGTYTAYDDNGNSLTPVAIEIIITDSNSYQLVDEGDYSLSVTALGTGYFDDSQPATGDFYVGYMPQIQVEDFTWNDGQLSWTIDESKYDAKYQVQVDGTVLDEQEATSIDLTETFEGLSVGEHEVSVYVIDKNGEKMTRQSEFLLITKLDTPEVEYQDGEMVLSAEYFSDVQYFQVVFSTSTESNVKTLTFDDLSVSTSFDGVLETGVYTVSISVVSEGLFFHSDALVNKVYKLPTLEFSSSGGTANSTTITIQATSSSTVVDSVQTSVKVLENNFDNVQVDGFDVTLSMQNAGQYTLSAVQTSSQGYGSYSDGTDTVYVLNSDASESVTITKLTAFEGEVTHQYNAESNSVLTFNEVDGATSYTLWISNGEEYVQVDSEKYSVENGKITLVGKVEDLFEVESRDISLQIVTTTGDDEFVINSAITKTLTILSAPTSANSGNSTSKTYSWTPSANADGYLLVVYHSLDGTPSASGEPTVYETPNAFYEFESVGYYRVQIYAISDNENVYISSVECFEETFYISEQLQLGQVQLGYNEERVNSGTGATGYYLQIGSTENITNYQISLTIGSNEPTTQTYEFSTGGIYNLTEAFSDSSVTYTLTVTGTNTDSTIYRATEITTLTIVKIASAVYSDNDAQSDIIISDYKPTSTVTLRNKNGASSLEIYENSENFGISYGSDATLILGDKNTYSLSFYYYGTYVSDTKLYGTTDGIIYLDSDVTTLTLNRISRPYNLAYSSGSLTFSHDNIAYVDDYVLDIVCTTSAEEEYTISIRISTATDGIATVVYGENTYDLGPSSEFFSTSDSSVTIDLSGLIEELKETELSGIYAQAAELEFSVYAHRTALSGAEGTTVQISSNYATVNEGGTSLTIEKLSAVELSYSYTTGALTWEAVNDATSYVLYGVTNEPITITSTSYAINAEGTFYVVATSPYCLDSATSNIVTLKQLGAVTRVQVINGKLSFSEYLTTGTNYISVTISGTSQSNGTYENTTGELELSSDSAGTYVFQVIGTSVATSDGGTTYYLNSATTTYTLSATSTLAPTDTGVTIQDQTISWNSFGSDATLNTLTYYVYFVDVSGSYVRYETSSTSVEYYEVASLLASLENGLATGTITVYVVASLGSYYVEAGGTIYYAIENTVFSGLTAYNHFVYTENDDIEKLASPKIVNVEFEPTDGYSQTPDIKVTFEGNYGTSATFNIYIIGETGNTPIEPTVSAASASETYQYTFTISATSLYYWNYVQNGVLQILISVKSAGDHLNNIISYTILEINQYAAVSGLTFQTQTIEGVTYNSQVLVIEKGDASGSVALTLTTEENYTTTVLVTESTYDLSTFISTYLQNGGILTISAYINYYSGEGTYYLPSASTISIEYIVLATPSITRTSAGFEIDDDNSVEVFYIIYISENQTTYVLSNSDSDDLQFVLPEVSGTITYTITAVTSTANGNYISSQALSETYIISRLGNVTGVTFGRNENNQIEISWDAVTNASGYEITVYVVENETYTYLSTITLGDVSSHTQNSTITYTVYELFGESYADLSIDLSSGAELRLEIVAKGNDSTYNDSVAQAVNFEIIENSHSSSDFAVENGTLVFERQGNETYLYRILTSENIVVVGWTTLSSNTIDTSAVDEEDGFYVQIMVMGDLSSLTDIVLDSVWISSEIYIKSLGISNIAYNEQTTDSLSFTLEYTNVEKIYVSTESDGIFTGNYFEFTPIETDNLDGNTDEYIFTYSLIEILQGLGVTSQRQLYFWVLSSNGEYEYVVSNRYASFTYGYENSVNFYEDGDYIVKDENNLNTYVLFTSTKTTLGIYVTITQGDETYIVFVDNAQLVAYASEMELESLFAINLVDLFDNLTDDEDNELDLTGTLSMSFTRVSLISGVYTISATSSALEFYRLAGVTNVEINRGNLAWSVGDTNADGYYVYIYTDLENNSFIVVPSSSSTTFNVSDYVGTGTQVYLAVKGVSSGSLMTLASKKVFDTDDEGNPLVIYRNQINSPLILEGGTLKIEWSQSDDLFQLLTQSSSVNYSDLADALSSTVFTSPFTFTLSDLINGNISLCLRFTNTETGVVTTFTVDASLFLASFLNFAENNNSSSATVLENLQGAYNASQNSSVQSMITRFQNLLESGSFGVANKNTIFDEYFEALSAGAYTLDYCLIGGSQTINSAWYTYSNGLGGSNDNVIYVNATPKVSVTSSTDSSTYLTTYIITIRKSSIWNYSAGDFVQETADNYVLVIGSYAFAITKGNLSYSLSLIDSSDSYGTVPLTANESDTTLTLYINYNNGNSLLGVYESILSGLANTEMQIYAVGNNYSISSKSEYYSITFLTFSSFSVTDGEFRWTTQYNRQTTVLIQRNSEQIILQDVEGEGTTATRTFSFALDEYSSGTYRLQFIVRGIISNNTIYVDSATYLVDGVYKLAQPSLSNTYGYLVVDGSVNTSNLQNTHSDNENNGIYQYKIYNDISTDQSYYTLLSNTAVTNYAVGTTGMSDSDDAYSYKLTEQSAEKFTVIQLGSTAVLTTKDDTADNYYIKNVICQEDTEGHIALRSKEVEIEASMLSTVTGLEISSDGILTWNAVTGNLDGTTIESGAKIVYKVTLTTYTSYYSSTNETSTEDVETKVYYTLETQFDFKYFTLDTTDCNIRATVQAFAGVVNNESGLELVEGGYVNGEVKYTDGTYVLMGNGAELTGITQIDSVTSLSVTGEGKLSWIFSVSTLYDVTDTNLLNYYAFIVTDENDNEISGQFSVYAYTSAGENLSSFLIIFTEDAGEIQSGKHTLTVYVTRTSSNSNAFVKSKGTNVEVTKLATVGEDDYAIVNSGSDEMMTFESYFATTGNENNILQVSVTMSEGTYTFELNADQPYITILREGNNSVEEYVLVVGNNDSLTITIKAIVENPETTNTLFSDQSETITLERSSGVSNITWNETTQTFSWEFTSSASASPVYIVEARYASGETRTYTTTSNSFTPTIIGDVSISVIVKVDNNNLQSASTSSNQETFNLFSGGSGTSTAPYVIQTTAQFQNIAYRMTKDSYLVSYTQNGTTHTEESMFYFDLRTSVNLEFEGIYFQGDFGGVIIGNGNTITYTSTGVSELSTSVTIRTDLTQLTLTDGESLVYNYGSALFENFTSTARVSGIVLNVNFGGENYTTIANNALMSGLVINNAGTISGVTVTSFETYFYGDYTNKYAHAYSGIASINQGSSATISNCELRTSISISDYNNSVLISFGGIAYTNYATITSCSTDTGTVTVTCATRTTFVQLAGIVVTNATSSIMTYCANNLSFSVSAITNNNVACYVAGVVVLTKSGFSGTNTNSGTCSFTNDSNWSWSGTYIST